MTCITIRSLTYPLYFISNIDQSMLIPGRYTSVDTHSDVFHDHSCRSDGNKIYANKKRGKQGTCEEINADNNCSYDMNSNCCSEMDNDVACYTSVDIHSDISNKAHMYRAQISNTIPEYEHLISQNN